MAHTRTPFVTARTEFKSDVETMADFHALVQEDGSPRLIHVLWVVRIGDDLYYVLKGAESIKVTQNPIIVTVD